VRKLEAAVHTHWFVHSVVGSERECNQMSHEFFLTIVSLLFLSDDQKMDPGLALFQHESTSDIQSERCELCRCTIGKGPFCN